VGGFDFVRQEGTIRVHMRVQVCLECCIFGMVGKIHLTKLVVLMLNL
jgi:hypothetical protein